MDWLLGEYSPIADALHAQEEALARAPADDMDRGASCLPAGPRRLRPHGRRLLAAARAGAARRLRSRRQRAAAGDLPLRRREEHPLARPGPPVRARPAPPRRARQPPGLPRRRVARGLPDQVRRDRPHRLPQSLPARPCGRRDTRARRRPHPDVQRRVFRLPRGKAPPVDLAATRLRRQPETPRPARGAGEAIRADSQVEGRSRMGQEAPGAQVPAGAREEAGRRKARAQHQGRQRRLQDRGEPIRHRPAGAGIQQGLRRPPALRRR